MKLFVPVVWSFLLVTLGGSYILAPGTRFLAGHPCRGLRRLRSCVMVAICENSVAEMRPAAETHGTWSRVEVTVDGWTAPCCHGDGTCLPLVYKPVGHMYAESCHSPLGVCPACVDGIIWGGNNNNHETGPSNYVEGETSLSKLCSMLTKFFINLCHLMVRYE